MREGDGQFVVTISALLHRGLEAIDNELKRRMLAETGDGHLLGLGQCGPSQPDGQAPDCQRKNLPHALLPICSGFCPQNPALTGRFRFLRDWTPAMVREAPDKHGKPL